MSRIIQPSVAKRIAFATWARRNAIPRTSSATFVVPDDVEVPESLMIGAQIDGKPQAAKPTTRRRTRKQTGPVEEPAAPVPAPTDIEPQESYVQKYERQQAEAQANQEE